MNWKLDQLKSHLSQNKAIRGWVIHRENVHRRERYFMMDGKALIIDQDRNVHAQNIHLTLHVDIGKPGRQGEISKKLFTTLPLKDQIDSAIRAAQQTDHQAWDLPKEIPSQVPQLATTDMKMAEDLERVTGELTDRIGKVVAQPRNTQFNSSELFLSVHHNELHLSNGLVHRSSQSRIYNEAAYSFARKDKNGKTESDEYLNTMWAVSLNDLPIEKMFDETSERAEHSLDIVKPETGKYPVIVDAEVLAMLFNTQISQLSSGNSYHGLPFVKPGDDLVKNATGDLLTLTLDPSLEFGADTVAVSEDGLLQKQLKLVDRNKVVATSTSKRYADYLNIPVTTIRGNVVVDPGTLSYEQLKKQAPKVIEILQFSGLFADPNTGTFSSEIRLAKLYDNETGKVTYLKGGSLSGSFGENMRGVRLSSHRIKRAHFESNSSHGSGYYGPDYALLSDVSIVG